MSDYTLTDGEVARIAGHAAELPARSAPVHAPARGARVGWAVTALRLLGLALLLGWSAKWLPPMFAMIGAQTAIGQHGLHGLPDGYEVFELLFVAGHCAVRWLPGVAGALGLFWISGRLRRRVRAR